MGQQPKPRGGKNKLAPTTLPVDSTHTYMKYVGIMRYLVCIWPLVFGQELICTSMSTLRGATAEGCAARILGFSRYYPVLICTGI